MTSPIDDQPKVDTLDQCVPAYLALARHLRESILKGDVKQDQQLPTELQLVAQFGVSRQTVRRAFEILSQESLVRRTQGSGTYATPDRAFVNRGSQAILDNLVTGPYEAEVVHPLEFVANPAAAARLQLTDDWVAALTLRRLRGGLPIMVAEVTFTPEYGEILSKDDQLASAGVQLVQTPLSIVERVTGMRVAESIDQSFTAVVLPAALGRLLDCDANCPAIRVDSTVSTSDGHPVELSIAHYHPSRYSYRIKRERSRW